MAPITIPSFSFTDPASTGSFLTPYTQFTADSSDILNINYNIGAEIANMQNDIPVTPDFFSKDAMFGYTDKFGKHSGWGGQAIGLGLAAANAYTGLKKLGIMEDSLKFQKNAFSKQFENQRKLTNLELSKWKKWSINSNRTGAVNAAADKKALDDYMAKNRV